MKRNKLQRFSFVRVVKAFFAKMGCITPCFRVVDPNVDLGHKVPFTDLFPIVQLRNWSDWLLLNLTALPRPYF